MAKHICNCWKCCGSRVAIITIGSEAGTLACGMHPWLELDHGVCPYGCKKLFFVGTCEKKTPKT